MRAFYMEGFDLSRFIFASLIAILILTFAYTHSQGKKRVFSAKFLVRSAIFAAFSIILYIVPIFNIPLPIFPSFLKLHFDEIPIFIAGFAYGPMSAVFILMVKTLVKLPLTITFGVGELADLIYSLAFILPACFIYRKHRSIKGALIAFLVGMVFQLLASTFITTFIILGFYMNVMGMSEEMLLGACQAVNPAVTNLTWPFFFIISLPFNAIKDIAVIVLTFILYKRLHLIIDKIKVNEA